MCKRIELTTTVINFWKTVKYAKIWVLCIIYNCIEQQLFTILLEQQPYDRIYVI